MTKNNCNGKKSIFWVFLGYAVTNSKKFPEQNNTGENLLRSVITDFRDYLFKDTFFYIGDTLATARRCQGIMLAMGNDNV